MTYGTEVAAELTTTVGVLEGRRTPDSRIIYQGGTPGPRGAAGVVTFGKAVRVATTANITIATALNNGDTLNGVVLATGDLVLIGFQTAPAENGIYVVGTTPIRDLDFDTINELAGQLFTVQEGTLYADTLWICTTNKGGTINVSAVTFQQFTASTIASGVTFTPFGNIAATNVQTAIQELDTEKAGLALANIFSASQKIALTTNSVLPVPFIVTREVTVSNSGAGIEFQRARFGPAAVQNGDRLFDFGANGYDGAQYPGQLTAVIRAFAAETFDATHQGSYMDFFTTLVGTVTRAERLSIGPSGGVYHRSATGGDKGNNTINFGAIYDDNTLLTCMALAKEFLSSGKVNLKKWDAMVPDQIEPEQRERVPVMVERRIRKPRLERSEAGDLVIRTTEQIEKVPDTYFDPIWTSDGIGIDAIEVPFTEEIITPAKTIKRQHRTARIFKAMLEAGFDPRDPEQYFIKMQSDEALPGMPTQADWKHNDLSIGEQHSRQWLAMEMLAIVCNVMWGKIKDHEARLTAAGL